MHSELVISTPAPSSTLLSVQQRRDAIGATDGSLDPKLAALDAAVAQAIADECSVAVGKGGQPTLKQETLTETVRGACGEVLVLSRRHQIEITSIVADGATLAAEDYSVDPESGIVARLSAGLPIYWSAQKIVVVYQAGFADGSIPADLQQAASDFIRLQYALTSRDPALKSETVDIPGVMRTERSYWVGSVPGQSSDAVPDIVAGQLRRYRNIGIA